MKLLSFTNGVCTKKALIQKEHSSKKTGGLSVFFAILCIVDLFGVFPIIALPKSVIACGIYAIPLVFSVFGLQLYTAALLGRSWILAQEITPQIREKNRLPYAAVAELAFGPYARNLVTFLIDATVFSAGVPNFIVAAQSMQLFCWKISSGEISISYCLWMLLLGLLLCPIMWLGSPKDMKPVAVISVCIVSTVTLSIWSCILSDDVTPPRSGAVWETNPNLQDFLVVYSIIAFQFDIHPMLLTIQVDMKDNKKINTAVLGGFAVTGSMFAITSALAAYRYGTRIEYNILQGIPPSLPLYVVALLVTLQLCLSSAVGNSALFQHIEDLLHIPREFCVQRCIVRCSIIALAVFLGEIVPRFDLVMGFIGSTFTGPLMFIFPSLFFLKLCYMKSNLNSDPYFRTNATEMLQDNKYKDFQDDRQQNEPMSNTPIISWNSFEMDYKTFEEKCTYKTVIEKYNVRWYDVLIAAIVVLVGVVATIAATYLSWIDVKSYAVNSQSCLINATAAARSFLL